MNAIPDLQLSSELQELYLETSEWISQLQFLKDEFRFFTKLFNERRVLVKKHSPEQVLMIEDRLRQLQQKIKKIEELTIKHQHLIESMLKDKDLLIGLELIEQNVAIGKAIELLLKADRMIKDELFVSVEKNKI